MQLTGPVANLTLALLASLLLCGNIHAESPAAQDQRPAPQDLKIGMFITLAWTGGNFGGVQAYGVRPEDKDKYDEYRSWVEAINVQGLVNDLDEMGMQFLIFSAWHGGRNPLWPNSKVNRQFRGEEDLTHLCDRDVLKELLDAAEKKGIAVLFYMQPNRGKPGGKWNEVMKDKEKFNDVQCALVDEMGKRYGTRPYGFWIDCPGRALLDRARFGAALRKHNPDGVFFGNSARMPKLGYAKENVYGASEGQILKAKKKGAPKWGAPAKWYYNKPVDQAPPRRWQSCPIIGSHWWIKDNRPKVGVWDGTARHSGEYIARYTMFNSSVNEAGGIAWSCGMYVGDGPRFEPGVKAAFVRAKEILSPVAEALYGTRPDTAWPTLKGTGRKRITIATLPWGGSATMAADKSATYLSLFQRPEGHVLKLPAARDQAVFTGAKLLNAGGGEVRLEQTPDGVTLALPKDMKWNQVVTVIKLERKADL